MSYRHKARFVPRGESPESASKLHSIEFVTDNFRPKENEVRTANESFRDRIDSYAARNYWSLYDFVTGYAPSSNLADIESLEKFLDEKDWVEKIVNREGKQVSYLDIRTDESSSKSDVLDSIDEYRDDNTKVFIDTGPQELRLYYKWHTVHPSQN